MQRLALPLELLSAEMNNPSFLDDLGSGVVQGEAVRLGLLEDKAVRTFFHQLCTGVAALHTPRHERTCEAHLLRGPEEWLRDLRVADNRQIGCRAPATIECSACGALCAKCDADIHETPAYAAFEYTRTHVKKLDATCFVRVFGRFFHNPFIS
jgi:hypothetical protein